MPNSLLPSSPTPSLLRRAGITLGALLIYRAGSWIPLPGIDVASLVGPGDVRLLGGGLERVSIMALGLLPMLSALMLLEAALIASPRFRRWSLNPRNAARLTPWTVVAALAFAAVQSYGLATAFEELGGPLVTAPGSLFRAGVVVTQVGATAALIWLASLITRHGIGSGIWILIGAPYAIFLINALVMQAAVWGPFSPVTIAATVALLALAIALMATLLKASPPLAEPGDLVWVPVLGFALSHWALSFVWIGQRLLLPPGQAVDFDAFTSARGFALLPVLGLAIVALLRRRSLAIARGVSISCASVAGLVVATAIPTALGAVLQDLSAQPLFPSAVSVMLLAGVGLSIATGLGTAEPSAPPSSEA